MMVPEMFPEPGPRVFALPPGAAFARLLAQGLRARAGAPEALARVTVYVPTARMRTAVARDLAEGGALLLPRLRLVDDIGRDALLPGTAAPVSPLRRRLELAALVARLVDAVPGLAPRTAVHDLADSLAGLLAEMQAEGVGAADIARLDAGEHALHWARTTAFLDIALRYAGGPEAPDPAGRLRQAVLALAEGWQAAPPADPVIVAGSTGSVGTTLLLMAAVARLPQGALVLPGFDFDLPGAGWAALDRAPAGEDHPQFRLWQVLRALEVPPAAVRPWAEGAAPDAARNRLVSLALRPAPVTDQWLAEGSRLDGLAGATAGLTLIEAQTPRDEALAIALILRQAAEEGRTAALISPDRGLTRRVAAALDRWRIRADDSAGEPLSQTAPGRLLRQVADLWAGPLTAEALLALLKHPLVAAGGDRGAHLRAAQGLELRLRRHGPPFPDAVSLEGAAREAELDAGWAAWLCALLPGEDAAVLPLAAHVERHLRLAEALAAGPGGAPLPLWQARAGEAALALMRGLAAEAGHGAALDAVGYRDLLRALAGRVEVREGVEAHPLIRILGPREARVGAEELVILGGLNEGSWPQRPAPDPWLNRALRAEAGLPLPERQIGLSAHDFQIGVGARQVVLTRAHRDADAETVPARWLNRLVNLLDGLPQGGPQALAAMRARGRGWLDLAARAEAGTVAPAAPRPAPRPPVAARPRRLSVTEIARLIRDPYWVYARHVLRLEPLDPLRAEPDARLRGTVLHAVLEGWVKERPAGESAVAGRARLLAVGERVLAAQVPWPAARALFRARLARAAAFLTEWERESGGQAVLVEAKARLVVDPPGVVLTGKPDRIDLMPDGSLQVVDYKTGAPPSKKAQKHFDRQLRLLAVMAAEGAFAEVGAVAPGRVTYLGLGSQPKLETAEITAEEIAAERAGLVALWRAYLARDKGFASRRAVQRAEETGDYDHLARFGEWQQTDLPAPEDVG